MIISSFKCLELVRLKYYWSLFCSPTWLDTNKNSNIVKYSYSLKEMFSIEIVSLNVVYFRDQSWILSIIIY